MYILAYDFGTGGIKASLYGADGACVESGFDAYPDSIAKSDAEAVPDALASGDYSRRYARLLELSGKLGEWAC